MNSFQLTKTYLRIFMCGRFGQIDKKALAKAYGADETDVEAFPPNYNTDVGSYALILPMETPKQFALSAFGLTPFWADKPKYVINARAEGDSNQENDPAYRGEKGIFKKPFFRHLLKSKRCIVPVQYFIEGPKRERLKKPYLVERKDGRPFALAGLYDEWVNRETGEVLPNFTIITTPRNELLERIGHHRAPLVIPDDAVPEWLYREKEQKAIASMMEPFDPKGFHAYRVSSEIRRRNNKGQNNDPSLTEPIGAEFNV